MRCERAPGRGRYSRERSAVERFRDQRRRLLEATAIAMARGENSVSAVSRIAGVGRTTFYECFDDYRHATAAAQRFAVAEVSVATTIVMARRGGEERERVRELCAQWVRVAHARPAIVLCALASEACVMAFVSAVLANSLRDVGKAMSTLPSEGKPDGVALGIAGSAIEVARAVALAALQEESGDLSASAQGLHVRQPMLDVGEAEQALTVAVQKLLG